MKTPISYYGGKQRLVSRILPLFPEHQLYCEPFAGGAALFFAKQPSEVEVINDTNAEVVNFYKVLKRNYTDLEKRVQITLHSRQMHADASVIYNNSHLFSELDRAWAFWVLSSQSFSSIVDGSWGFDRIKNTTSKKIANKISGFNELLSIRVQNVQIECAGACYVVKSRDFEGAFFYCDPPYFNADMGHYGGYKRSDFEELLRVLSGIKGKFLLSSYPSDLLTEFTQRNGWNSKIYEQTISVNNRMGSGGKAKFEVLTANYAL